MLDQVCVPAQLSLTPGKKTIPPHPPQQSVTKMLIATAGQQQEQRDSRRARSTQRLEQSALKSVWQLLPIKLPPLLAILNTINNASFEVWAVATEVQDRGRRE